ncbi:MAG: hypothetical protein K2W94_05135 [Alphaproteobacteria bacterium]|nr:hypothetical protein [Alphaproteobacteria bacterium]
MFFQKYLFYSLILFSSFTQVSADETRSKEIRDSLRTHRYSPRSAMGEIAGDVGKLVTQNQLERTWGDSFVEIVNGKKYGFSKRNVSQEELHYAVPALAALAVKNPKRDMWSDLIKDEPSELRHLIHILNVYTTITLFQKLNEAGFLSKERISEDMRDTYDAIFDVYLNEVLGKAESLGFKEKVSKFIRNKIIPFTHYIPAIPAPTPEHYKNIHDFHESFNPDAFNPFKKHQGAAVLSGAASVTVAYEFFNNDAEIVLTGTSKKAKLAHLTSAYQYYKTSGSTSDDAIEKVFDSYLKPDLGSMDTEDYQKLCRSLRQKFNAFFNSILSGSGSSHVPEASSALRTASFPQGKSAGTHLNPEDSYRNVLRFAEQQKTKNLKPLSSATIFSQRAEMIEGLDEDKQRYAYEFSDGSFIDFFLYWRDFLLPKLHAQGLPIHAYFDVKTGHVVLENILKEQTSGKFNDDFHVAKNVADQRIIWIKAAQFTVGHWVTVSVSKQSNNQYEIITWNSGGASSKPYDDERITVLKRMFARANGLQEDSITTRTIQLGNQVSNQSCGIWVFDVIENLTRTGSYDNRMRSAAQKAQREADLSDQLVAYANLRTLRAEINDDTLRQEIQRIRRERTVKVEFNSNVYGILKGETYYDYFERLIATIKKAFNANASVQKFIHGVYQDLMSVASIDPNQYPLIINGLRAALVVHPDNYVALNALIPQIKQSLIDAIEKIRDNHGDNVSAEPDLNEIESLVNDFFYYTQHRLLGSPLIGYVQAIRANLSTSRVLNFLKDGSQQNKEFLDALATLDDDIALAPRMNFSTIQKLIRKYYDASVRYPVSPLPPRGVGFVMPPEHVALEDLSAGMQLSSSLGTQDLPNISDLLTENEIVRFNSRLVDEADHGGSLKTWIGSSWNSAKGNSPLTPANQARLEAYTRIYLGQMGINVEDY